jgi:hypothetical protein
MTEMEAEGIYNSLSRQYNHLRAGFPRALLGELRRVMNLHSGPR